MKRSERHHLKENELATSVRHLTRTLAGHRREIAVGVTAVVVVVAGLGGYAFWRERVRAKSGELLARAMTVLEAPVVPPAPPAEGSTQPPVPPTPGSYASERAKLEAALPRFEAVIAAYPTATSGIAARYQTAAILAALGRTADAERRYEEVIAEGSGLYVEMARLGLAHLQSRGGRHDAAISRWKQLAARTDDTLPLDAVLVQLGRAYAAAGKSSDAIQTFNRLISEFPESGYAAVARQELDLLKAPAKPSL
jgi:hypothetical protein